MDTNPIVRISQKPEFHDIYNNTLFDEVAINFINTKKWEIIEITKLHINSKHVTLFNNDDKWQMGILQKPNSDEKYNYDVNVLLKTLSELNINLELIDKKYIYHFLLFDNSYRLIELSKSSSRIHLLWVNDDNQNIINENLLCAEIKKMQIEKKIHFSCLDELLTSLEIMNNSDVLNKNISYGGYCARILSDGICTFCILYTDIYKNIINIFTDSENKYIKFLELYQSNKLTAIIPFLHKYPSDVVRRINISIRTISKEILNIYHLTRRQQNSELYDALPRNYRDVIYNLHKIYVNEKCDDYSTSDKSSHNTELENRKKKSVSVDIVYNYLKNMKKYDLLKLFENRNFLMESLDAINYNYSQILYINNIDIKVQLTLMFHENISN